MYPRYDRERGSYGIQESFLGRYYVEILSLPEKEKQMLKHWKNPSYQPVGAPAGDFVGTLAYILNTRCIFLRSPYSFFQRTPLVKLIDE